MRKAAHQPRAIGAGSVQRARAVPVAEIAARYTELKRSGAWLMGCCPLHDDARPSFGIKGDHWCCFSGCGRGDVIDLVQRMEHIDFLAAVRWLLNLPAAEPWSGDRRAAHVGQPGSGQRLGVPAGRPDTAARVGAILAECGPVVEGTAAHLYLWTRGLKTKQPGLLAHPALFCSEIRGPLPALVAPLGTRGVGPVSAVQRIWCKNTVEYDGSNPHADARAALVTRKKTLGHMGDASVRLGGLVDGVIGLAEGVESAIAASMLFHIPVWAVCGAARLGLVWVPPSVREVWVFGDNGNAGRQLARRAVEHWGGRGMRALAVFPDVMYGDFCDALIGRRL